MPPGGIWKAVESCTEMGGSSFALFLGSQRSWKRPALDQTAAAKFREQCIIQEFDPAHILPHGSYLMNCGSPKEGLSDTDGCLLLQILSVTLIPWSLTLSDLPLSCTGYLISLTSSPLPLWQPPLVCVPCCTQMCLRRARPCWWMNSAAAAFWALTSTTSTLAPPWAPSPLSSAWKR